MDSVQFVKERDAPLVWADPVFLSLYPKSVILKKLEVL